MILKLITNSDVVQEIRVKEIVEIDGKPFEGIRSVDLGNLEDRIQILERLVKNLCDFMDQFVVQDNPNSELGDALKPSPSECELVER